MPTEIIIPSGLIVLVIGGLIAVKVSLEKRPTYKETDETYQKKESCDLIHKSVDEKLSCVPKIKTKVIRIETKLNLLLSKNGIEYEDNGDEE